MPRYFFWLTTLQGNPAAGSAAHGIRHGAGFPLFSDSIIGLVMRSRISFCKA